MRAALAFVFREVEAERLDVARARALIYAASVLLNAITGTDLEGRIARLEKDLAP